MGKRAENTAAGTILESFLHAHGLGKKKPTCFHRSVRLLVAGRGFEPLTSGFFGGGAQGRPGDGRDFHAGSYADVKYASGSGLGYCCGNKYTYKSPFTGKTVSASGYTTREVDAGGYLVAVCFGTTGKRSMEFRDSPAPGLGDRIKATGITLSVDVAKDRASEERRWMDAMIDKYAAGETDSWTRLKKVMIGLPGEFYYDFRGYSADGEAKMPTGGVYNSLWTAAEAMRPYWVDGRADCYAMPAIMMRVAEYMGATDFDSGYKDTIHYWFTCKIDGKPYPELNILGKQVLQTGSGTRWNPDTQNYTVYYDFRTFEGGRLL